MVRHVVVVGNGMVGSRFAEELASRDREGQFAVTLLGAEEYEPYNRVLLSDLVAGKVTAASLTLPSRAAADGFTAHRGAEVVAIDRGSQLVVAADGAVHRYDELVLATGAQARIPPIAGLAGPDGGLPGGVHCLRTLDDAREIVAATINATAAVVVGGGVLGLEVACGLARRGVATTIVHAADALMERQLDGAASQVVEAALARAGVTSLVAALTSQVVLRDGRAAGLVLADGRTVPADLVVLSCGTIPQTALARQAGLDVDRGIVVGPDLTTPADPRVHAIGDCAQPPEGGTGLIAQGWDQARRLAEMLASRRGAAAGAGPDHSAPGTADPTTDVVRVKATGLDVVAMGVPPGARDSGGHQVIRLTDPARLRHVEIVAQDGVLVGATCIGAGQVAADLTVAYTRRTPLPADPAQLLIRPVHTAPEPATTPTNMPDRMTVCRCNGVTKRDIVSSWSRGARSLDDVAARTRATTGCGGCRDVVEGLVGWLASSDPDTPAASAGPLGATSHAQAARREPDVPAVKHNPHGAETRAG